MNESIHKLNNQYYFFNESMNQSNVKLLCIFPSFSFPLTFP
jgi:hypothetical protein